MADIVDGKDCPRGAEGRVFEVLCAQQDGNECRLPIVAVENIRDAEDLGCFENCAAEEGEAFGIIRKVAGRGSIEPFAVKKGG